MTNTKPKRATAFIVVFSVIALLINSTQSHGARQQRATFISVAEQQQQQAEMQKAAAAKQAAEDAAAKHAAYLARYLNGGFSKTLGTKTLALVVAVNDNKIGNTIGGALVNHFKNNSVQISTSFFKPEFISDSLFDSVFAGSTEVVNQLELAKSLDALLLARLTVEYSTSAALDNLTTAHVRLEIQLVPIAGNTQSQTWTFTANGPGFSQGEALSSAEERLTKQINNDTTMSLGF